MFIQVPNKFSKITQMDIIKEENSTKFIKSGRDLTLIKDHRVGGARDTLRGRQGPRSRALPKEGPCMR
jgi:hypothetical protein